ncbi:ubiquinone biosynthesis protein COQ9, mitochondrial [Ctenocephalides felis]|uniref:ubiquinone biosynthesis protein COQ9, mitochondrial n=1 Tax=Ctenocephalides felis TaxID=7515 RepID=UPI000E6E38A0|nr:ubiquinone biosynthesis protein COQ9, mitochondrial [Ctenocephalides felis]
MSYSAKAMNKLQLFNKNYIKYFHGKLLLRCMTSNLNAVNSSENENNTKNIKQKILEASLPFVVKHGWTYQTIGFGAESMGMPNIVHGLFPNGGLELVLYFYNQCNGNLEKLMQEHKSLNMTAFDFIWFAIRERLLMNTPYMKQWPQALALLAMPNNIHLSMPTVLKLADDICYHAGDRSVDFRWYSRRLAVLGIYKSTELYMLQDGSQNYESTWNFLSRRVKDAEDAKRNLDNVDKVLDKSTETANAAFMTVKNMLNIY